MGITCKMTELKGVMRNMANQQEKEKAERVNAKKKKEEKKSEK